MLHLLPVSSRVEVCLFAASSQIPGLHRCPASSTSGPAMHSQEEVSNPPAFAGLVVPRELVVWPLTLWGRLVGPPARPPQVAQLAAVIGERARPMTRLNAQIMEERPGFGTQRRCGMCEVQGQQDERCHSHDDDLFQRQLTDIHTHTHTHTHTHKHTHSNTH